MVGYLSLRVCMISDVDGVANHYDRLEESHLCS